MSTLPSTMRAIVCHGPQDYRLERVNVPVLGPGEVLVHVDAVGVCASDLKCYHGASLFWGDEHRQGYCEPPVIAGHEFVGTVVALGAGASEARGLREGDKAISEQIVPCWDCRFCRRGQYWMCQSHHHVYGFKQDAQGAMAEYMKFPVAAIVHKVPDDLPVELGAVVEPLACSLHAVERGEIRFGDVVVVAGCGTLGLGMVAGARLKSPGLVVAVDIKDYRLEKARTLGAQLTINAAREDAVQRVLDLTEGYGCDVYFEASGHPSAVEQGLRMIRKLGTFVEFSVMGQPVTVDWTIIGDTKELNIHGSHLGPYCYPLAIQFLRDKTIDGSELVTHKLPLERFAEAFEIVHAGKDAIKVLLIP